MRGVYDVNIRIASVTTARTLVYVTAAATHAIEILGGHVTDEDNETNEQIACDLERVATLGTPTATTLTPSKTENGDQAAACVAKGNVTASEPTYTANTANNPKGAPSLGGWVYDPTPEERMYIPPSGTVGLRLLADITSAKLAVSLRIREVG